MALLLVVISGTTKSKTNYLLYSDFDPYTITLDNTHNKLVTSLDFQSGSGEIHTALNNPITFNYFDLCNNSSGWQTLKADGSFENTVPISGLNMLTITKASSGAHIKVYWSPIHLFDEEHFIEFDTQSVSEVSTSFNDEHPNYFKVVALGTTNSVILSISVQYSCVYDLPETLAMGMYPQSKVTDNDLIGALNDESGDLPTAEDSQAWTSYNYYISKSNETDFMWYIDIEDGGELYRGVYFTSYRPYDIAIASSTDNSYQDDNGYCINTRYWFKYEPIIWDVLLPNEAEGPLLLSNKLLDSQEYYHSSSNRTIDGKTVYANNYKESNVRILLNNNFYNTVFSGEEKALIAITTVDNSPLSTASASNRYACENTEDKLFLLSYQEVTNTTYGFNNDASRKKQATDYAKAMGVYVDSSNGNSLWWLRSPDYGMSYHAHYVLFNGGFYSYNVYRAFCGLLPAFRINR